MMEALGLKPKQASVPVHSAKTDIQPLIKREDPIQTQTKRASGLTGAPIDAERDEERQIAGLGFRKFLKPTDWTDVQDVEDMLEAKGEDIVVKVQIKQEIVGAEPQKRRVFGPSRPVESRIKEEAGPEETSRRDRSRSRDRHSRH